MQNESPFTAQQKHRNLIELGYALLRLRDACNNLSLILKDYQYEVDTQARAAAKQEVDHIVQKLRKPPGNAHP